MASASDRAFAIQELFEQIMLSDCISLERLSILRRVSQVFNATIAASFYLQGKMRLRHLTQQEREDQGSSDSGVNMKVYNLLATRPFYFLHSTTERRASGFHILSLIISTDMLEFFRHVGARLGLKGRKRIHTLEGSWSQMRLSVEPLALRVKIVVTIPQYGSCHKIKYTDVIVMQPEDRTIGNLILLLQRVASRSHSEHLTLAYEPTPIPHELVVHAFTPQHPGRPILVRQFAEKKAFADPKLLERVFLNLELKQLFAIQRLSTSVKNAIDASVPLMTQMQLLQSDLDASRLPRLPFSISGAAIDLLMTGQMELGAFNMKFPTYDPWDEKAMFSFGLSRDFDSDAPSVKFGVKGRDKVFHAKNQTWRTIKLSPTAVPVVLVVDVRVRQRFCYRWRYSYKEIVEFASNGTLGQLASVLQEVANRSDKTHWKKAEAGGTIRRVLQG
ncbi:hypothetical protein LTR36_006661 [Oleoguttula mirabilis]|uniref:F-box domain-containing protein n=1 Tax=Oleoguttula mirabilis TaxID=1507867 RepID=A0AAV9JCA1_9PEZI|nr:hypothetical protein LTR36_006661 [Oleoguttula mirabilis]